MIITTSQKAKTTIQEETQSLAAALAIPYVKREKKSISQLLQQNKPIAVVAKNQLTIHFNEEQEHTFHLSMAQLRLLRLQRGESDHLVESVQSLLSNQQQDFSFLDCTLGLASDSIIISYAFPKAHVEGIEASYPIWLATWYGLSHYKHADDAVTAALRRIKVQHTNFETYLKNLPDQSVDILYFDPMFEVPIEESPQFKPLRGHTVESAITSKVIREAMRVSRLGYIIKERPFSSVFKEFVPQQWIGGKYSRIGYGIWRVSREGNE